MTTTAAIGCSKGDLRAVMHLLLNVDLDGNPFWLHTNPMTEEQAAVQFYTCENCLEQFGDWEDAIKHVEEVN